MVGRGIIEFHWSDEDGKHRAQGDFDFWKFENEISLRVSKGGEPLMWIGCDETNHWMFDMLGDETILTINQEDIIFVDDSSYYVSQMSTLGFQSYLAGWGYEHLNIINPPIPKVNILDNFEQLNHLIE